MKNITKRFLSLLLAAVLLFSVLPQVSARQEPAVEQETEAQTAVAEKQILLSSAPETNNLTAQGYYTYAIENQQVTLVDYVKGEAQHITVPSTLSGYPVTVIGENVFRDCADIISVKIPVSVTAIGSGAFYGCSALKEVWMSGYVTAVGANAFGECAALESVTVHPGSEEIWAGIAVEEGNEAFAAANLYFSAHSFTKYVSDGNGSCVDGTMTAKCDLCEITDTVAEEGSATGNHSFTNYVSNNDATDKADGTKTAKCDNCEATHTVVDEGTMTPAMNGTCGDNLLWELTYDGVLTISGSGSMYADSSLPSAPWYAYRAKIQSIVLEEGITSIGSRAFYGCSEITAVELPCSVTTIGSYAFYNCTKLHTLKCAAGLKSIGSYAFDYTALKSVYYHGDEAEWNRISGISSGYNSYLLNASRYYSQHVYSDYVSDQNASCADGTKTAHCRICGKTDTVADPGTATGIHLFREYVSNNDATYKTDGTKTAKCVGCDKTDTVIDLGSMYAVLYSGVCGDDLSWVVDESGTLSIYGTGATWDVSGDYNVNSQWSGITAKIIRAVVEDGVTALGNNLFYGCSALKSVSLGKSLKTIAPSAFQNAGSSFSFSVDESNPYFAADDAGILYSKDMQTLVRWPGSPSSVTIPEHVKVIGDGAFYNSNLRTVVMGNDVEAIGNYAFYDCNLTSVEIPDSVTSIGSYAFYNCGFTSVEIPDSVTSIGDYAFCNNYNLSSVHFGSGLVRIGDRAFGDCGNLSAVELPDSLKILGDEAFCSCDDLFSVSFGNSLERIGDSTFQYCNKLTAVTIPDTVKSIGSSAFSSCTALSRLALGASVETIGSYAFSNCDLLKSVVLPDSVKTIGDYAFEYCDGLQSVSFGSGLVSIGSDAFRVCKALSVISFGNSVKKIGSYAFSGCTSLNTVNFHPGTSADWENIGIDYGNEALKNARRNYTDHVFETYVSDNNGTCQDGTKTAKCTMCGATDTVVVPGTATGIHSFTTYVSNNDATYTADGTKTAKCDHCDATNTVADKGSKLVDLHTGNCGTDVVWKLNSAGSLVISGKGSMKSLSSAAAAPWYEYRDMIKTVTVEEGVTSIGAYAFQNYNIIAATVADTVNTVGKFAFSNCDKLESVILPSGLRKIENKTFYDSDALAWIFIPASVTSIGDGAFQSCNGLKEVRYTGSESQWLAVVVGSNNSYLTGAKVIYQQHVHTFTNYVSNGDATCVDGTKTAKCDLCEVTNTLTDTGSGSGNHSFTKYVSNYDGTFTANGTQTAACDHCGAAGSCEDPDSKLVSIELLTYPYKTSYVIGEKPDPAGISFRATFADGYTATYDADALDTYEADMETMGKKTACATFRGCSATVAIAVHEVRTSQLISATRYPESSHNYTNNLNETKRFSWNGACDLTITFSNSTYVEPLWDYIYLYDGNYNLLGKYTGSEAAGLTVLIPGDSFYIRLKTDASTVGYGYSFASIVADKEGIVHPPVELPATVTCTQDGLSAGSRCEICDMVIREQRSVDALGHAFTRYIPNEDVTCTASGTKTARCDRCDATDTIVDAAPLGHSFTNYVSDENAGCTDGTKTAVCDRCDATDTVADKGSAVHNLKEYVDNNDATYFADGTKTGTCADCGETVTVTNKGTKLPSLACGQCGSNLSWWLTEDGVLTVSGSGSMMDFKHESADEAANAPWAPWKNSVKQIVIREGITRLGNNAFRGMAALTAVTLPDSLMNIGTHVFRDCVKLSAVELPKKLTAIGTYAFYNCDGMKNITIPDSVVSLGASAFRGSNNLETAVLGSGLASIPNSTFYMCSGLTSVTIAKSVKMVAADAFYYCSALKDVYYTGTATQWSAVTVNSGNTRLQEATVHYSHNHNYQLFPAVTVEATCTENGYVEYTCAYGDKYRVYLAPLGHTPGTWSQVVAPTCTETGHTLSQCVKCDAYIYTDITEALGHEKSQLVETVMPGCTQQGYSVYSCNRCQQQVLADYVDALDHDFSVVVGIEAPGCETEGYTVYGCSRCDAQINDDRTPPLGHDFSVFRQVVAPKCLEGGYTIYGCSRCTETEKREPTAPLKHDFSGDIVAIVPPTCEADGVSGISCIRCDAAQENGIIEALGHNAVLIPAVEPGCIEPGYTIGTKCGNCQLVFMEPAAVEPLGHSFTNYISNGDATQFADGTKTAKCDRCDATDTVVDEGSKLPSLNTSCGDDLTWTLDTEGTLTVSGTGDMYDYAHDTATHIIDAPWCALRNSIKKIVIEQGVTSIGDHAFLGCANLTELVLPDTLQSIGYCAFIFCESLAELHIPDSVQIIGDQSFQGCTALRSVYLGTGLTAVSYGAFRECASLTEIVIPYGVTYIGSYAFLKCAALDTVWLPHSVVTVDNHAFRACNALTKVYYTGSAADWDAISVGKNNTALTDASRYLANAITISALPAMLHYGLGESLDTSGLVLSVIYTDGTRQTVTEGFTVTGFDSEKVGEKLLTVQFGIMYCDYTVTVTEMNPGIRTQPESKSVISGETVEFAVTAGWAESYLWQYSKNGTDWFTTNVEGYTTDRISFVATAKRNGYMYRCVVTFVDGSVACSETAVLTVQTFITNVKNPNDQTVVLGFKGQFTTAAEGEGLRYQWQYKRPGSEKWIDTAMEGATKPTVYIESTRARDGYQYRCVITDAVGNMVCTEAATMRVLSFVSHPQDVFTNPNKTVTFTVSANVESGFAYAWQYRRNASAEWSNTTMAGYNTATLTVSATLARNGYQYRCIMIGSKNSQIISNPATLHVAEPVAVHAQPQSVTATVDQQVMFHVDAANVYSYQWYYSKNGKDWYVTAMTGATTDTLTVFATAARNGYMYRCVMMGINGGEAITDSAILTVQ